MVPRLVPVAVDTAQQIRNATATNIPPDTPPADAVPMSVSMNPLAFINSAITPASNQAKIINNTIGRAAPAIAASA